MEDLEYSHDIYIYLYTYLYCLYIPNTFTEVLDASNFRTDVFLAKQSKHF